MTFKHEKSHTMNEQRDKKSKSRNISLGFGLLLFFGLFLPFLIFFVFPLIIKDNAAKGPPLHPNIQLMEREKIKKEESQKSE